MDGRFFQWALRHALNNRHWVLWPPPLRGRCNLPQLSLRRRILFLTWHKPWKSFYYCHASDSKLPLWTGVFLPGKCHRCTCVNEIVSSSSTFKNWETEMSQIEMSQIVWVGFILEMAKQPCSIVVSEDNFVTLFFQIFISTGTYYNFHVYLQEIFFHCCLWWHITLIWVLNEMNPAN